MHPTLPLALALPAPGLEAVSLNIAELAGYLRSKCLTKVKRSLIWRSRDRMVAKCDWMKSWATGGGQTQWDKNRTHDLSRTKVSFYGSNFVFLCMRVKAFRRRKEGIKSLNGDRKRKTERKSLSENENGEWKGNGCNKRLKTREN